MTDLDARLRYKVDSMDSGSNNPDAAYMADALRAVLDLCHEAERDGYSEVPLGVIREDIARELGVSA